MLRTFIQKLQENNTLTDVAPQVSPVFEAPFLALDNQPVLFHDVDGSEAVMNVLGTRDALAMALGIKKEEMVSRLSNVKADGNVKVIQESSTLEVVSEPDLTSFPIMTHFERDGGPYITAGIVVSEYDGVMNASIHRLMVMGKDKLAVRLVPPRHTFLLHKQAAARGERLPVAIVLGPHPLIEFAVSTRVGEGEEFMYASALMGRDVELFECENGIKVPHAEIVLEGYIEPEEMADEGPFVDISGTYDIVRPAPVITLTRMMHRKNPIYRGLLPGGAEHRLLMGVPYEPKIFAAVSQVTKVKNVVLTEGGCCYFHAVVQIDKQTEGDGKNAIMAAFAAHTSLKHVVVVDDDIDIFDPSDIEFAIATRAKGDIDTMIITNVRGSSLDPRGSPDGTVTKMGIDATKVLVESEKFERAKIPDVSVRMQNE